MRRAYGFTIVELLITIVVIGILAAVSMTAYNGMQNKAKAAVTSSDLASIDKLHRLHAARHPGTFGSTEASQASGFKEFAEKIEWGQRSDPGFGTATTSTAKGRYYTYIGGGYTVYYWDYTEGAWRYRALEVWEGEEWYSHGYASENNPWNDRCTRDILEDCGQQGVY